MPYHTDMKSEPKSKPPSKRKGGNPWIQHVKKEGKRLGLKYNEALKDPRVKKSYKK